MYYKAATFSNCNFCDALGSSLIYLINGAPLFTMPFRKSRLGPSAVLGKLQCPTPTARPHRHCQMVGGGSKQGAKAGSKAVQWNPHLHCMELVEGEE